MIRAENVTFESDRLDEERKYRIKINSGGSSEPED